MRRTLLLVPFLIAVASAASAADRRLTASHPAQDLLTVAIEAGVGEVEIVASDTDTITVEVELSAKRSGMFGGRRSADLERAELRQVVRGRELVLEVRGAGRSRDFGEDWVVHMPRELALRLELGVGDVRVLDVAADIDVELGVGNVRIEGEHAAFGVIRGSVGVGDVHLRTPDGVQKPRGFLGKDLDTEGPGKAKLQVEIGVGDATIRLR